MCIYFPADRATASSICVRAAVLQFSLEPAVPPDTFTNNATEWLKSNILNMKAPKQDEKHSEASDTTSLVQT